MQIIREVERKQRIGSQAESLALGDFLVAAIATLEDLGNLEGILDCRVLKQTALSAHSLLPQTIQRSSFPPRASRILGSQNYVSDEGSAYEHLNGPFDTLLRVAL